MEVAQHMKKIPVESLASHATTIIIVLTFFGYGFLYSIMLSIMH